MYKYSYLFSKSSITSKNYCKSVAVGICWMKTIESQSSLMDKYKFINSNDDPVVVELKFQVSALVTTALRLALRSNVRIHKRMSVTQKQKQRDKNNPTNLLQKAVT